ncbi:MAG: signal peptidase I [Propionibacteriaceae bacterium]|nr:signal peptidase I [Propionibacteriaceae bacterium]
MTQTYDVTIPESTSRTLEEDIRVPDEALDKEFDAILDDASAKAPVVARPPSVWRDLAGLVAKIVVIVAVFGLIFSFTHGAMRNTDPDMAPTVKSGDLVLFYRLNKTYQVSDLVVLRYQGQMQVRRVVAQAGDVVDITADGLVVNGILQLEPDIVQPTHRYETGIAMPVTVGPGQVFVLGDARDNATDSRIYGLVNTQDTGGKVIAIVKWRDL